MITYDCFLDQEYSNYIETMKLEGIEPMEFDDWFKGSDYLENLYEEIIKENNHAQI